MKDPRTRFRDKKFIALTSYKRDGGAVETQMWFAMDRGRLYVRTDSRSLKVKRIGRNSSVSVAPCDFRGNHAAEPFKGEAKRMPDGEADRLGKIFGKKFPLGYYWEVWVLRPVFNALSRVGIGSGRGDPIFYEILPEDLPEDASPPAIPATGAAPALARLAVVAGAGLFLVLLLGDVIEPF